VIGAEKKPFDQQY